MHNANWNIDIMGCYSVVKKKTNYEICRKMDGAGTNHPKGGKSNSKRPILHVSLIGGC